MVEAGGVSRGPAASRPVWLCVFQVACPGVPPRFPDRPHVRVERKSIKPGEKLDAWLSKARLKKRPHLTQVLYDSMPAEQEPGGLENPFCAPHDQAAIKKALRLLREKLRCEGYTVGGNLDRWHVYAIELSDGHIVKKPKGYRGLVYVGQTSIPVDERVKQHRLGNAYPWKTTPKHSNDCHRYFHRYAPELIPQKYRDPIPCRRQALRVERDLRGHLERLGYRVIGGTDLLPKKTRGPKKPT